MYQYNQLINNVKHEDVTISSLVFFSYYLVQIVLI